MSGNESAESGVPGLGDAGYVTQVLGDPVWPLGRGTVGSAAPGGWVQSQPGTPAPTLRPRRPQAAAAGGRAAQPATPWTSPLPALLLLLAVLPAAGAKALDADCCCTAWCVIIATLVCRWRGRAGPGGVADWEAGAERGGAGPRGVGDPDWEGGRSPERGADWGGGGARLGRGRSRPSPWGASQACHLNGPVLSPRAPWVLWQWGDQ